MRMLRCLSDLRRAALTLLALALAGGPAWAGMAPLRFSSTDTDPLTLVSVLVLQEAYQAIGQTFVLCPYPSAQALSAANTGETDGALHRIKGIEKSYPDLVRIPVAINQTEPIAVIKRADIHIRDWAGLGSYRIGIVRSIVVYEQRTAGMDVTRLENLEQLLGMLDRNRLDVVVGDRLDALAALRNPAFSELHPQATPLETIPLYHYLHKRHRDWLPRLKAVLEKMRRSGRIQFIRNDVISRLQRGAALPPLPVPVERGSHRPS